MLGLSRADRGGDDGQLLANDHASARALPSDRMEFKSAGSCFRGRHTLSAEPRMEYLSELRQGLWSCECQALELSFRRSEFDWADFALLPHRQR